MTEQEINEWKVRIDNMSQIEMAHLHRFAPSGHVLFDLRYSLHDYFAARFRGLGGMTTEISKSIGWGVKDRIGEEGTND